ncbi:MAG: serine/threonine protein kinase, partial [Myxococcaceae bacterium]
VMMRRAAKDGIALGPKLATHLGIPLCDALGYVSQLRLPTGEPLNLVHRDVTPGNILISRTAEVKLTDFGVVKTSVNSRSTSVGVLKGKFAYMSPEQLQQRPLDHRSDIFSLGVVLYEVATGRRLWKRTGLGDLIAAVTACEVPRPTDFIPGFPEGFERILLKALAKDPADRYQDAREMMADLDAFKVQQGYTNGRRELSAMLGKLFPGAMPDASYNSSWASPIQPGSVRSYAGAPAPSLSAKSGSGLVMSAEDFLSSEGSSLPGAENAPSSWLGNGQLEVVLTLVVALAATALFWWRILST